MTVRARRAAVVMDVGHSRVLAHSMRLERALLCGDSIHMHGAITALCSDVFVERVPCYALDVVVMLGDLMNTFAYVHEPLLFLSR